jgi:hypothetical protein
MLDDKEKIEWPSDPEPTMVNENFATFEEKRDKSVPKESDDN